MNYRYVADIIIEAKTPLRLGSGKNALLQDSPVQKDWNGLPMILGSSLVGIMRDAYKGADENDIFGYQEEKKEEGRGSRVILSNALLLDEKGEVCESYLTNPSPFLQLFENLPIREHVAINDKGTTDKGAKFDEEIIFKGSRFKFRLELLSSQDNKSDKNIFENLLSLFYDEGIRIGAGSTKGFGQVAVPQGVILGYFNGLVDSDDYKALLSSLNDNTPHNQTFEPNRIVNEKTIYTLILKSDSFFMFGSGFGNLDNSADHTQVYEYVIDYANAKLYTEELLIPSTSIKGALSHRTAFYYNAAVGATIENGDGKVGEENLAVQTLFGYKKGKDNGQKGNIDFSDVYLSQHDTKIFDHVKIDRFTGGAMDSALFAEETATTEECIEIKLEVKHEALSDEKIKISLENALKDICTGMLSLGGMTTKGHGIFCGKLMKDDKCIIDKLSKGDCNDV